MRIILLLLLFSCGNSMYREGDVQTEPSRPKITMNQHNLMFETYLIGFPNRKKLIPIVFVEDMDAAGICSSWDDGHKEIEINIEIWNRSSEHQRQWLLWHEMGHCEQGLGHSNSNLQYDGGICVDDSPSYMCIDHVPLSLMHWYMPTRSKIPQICMTNGIDTITKTFCENLI